MKKTLTTCLMLALVACTSLSLAADGEKKAKAQKGRRGRRVQPAVQVPQGIELSAEQKKQVAAINKKYAPKMAALAKKTQALLSEEQRKARAAAFKANREAGKKGKAAQDAIAAASKLSDEQKKEMATIQKERAGIRKEAQGEFVALLTPEQKSKLPKRRGAGNRKKKKNA